MTHLGRKHTIGAALWGALLLGADAPPPAAPAASPLRVREVFVPYAEFRELTENNRDGVVMSLGEYRALVAGAAMNVRPETPVELPPIEAAVIDVRYEGTILGSAVKVRGACTIGVAAEGWVRCDLGSGFPNLGSVVLDDGPGWIVTENAAPQGGGAAPRAYLLLRGKGTHRLDVAFTLGIREEEDRSIIEGSLVPSPSARFLLDVPGTVEATAVPPHLTRIPKGESTQLVLALGTARQFSLSWRRTKSLAERETLLSAAHVIRYVPRSDSPVFTWSAWIQIARRKTGALVLFEPPGARVLSIASPLVHSWTRTDEGLQVLLNEPMLGEVVLEARGVLAAPGERYELGVPAVAGAYADTGIVALYAPSGAELRIESAAALHEVAPGDGGLGLGIDTGEIVPAGAAIARAYVYGSRDARVAVRVAPRSLAFETQYTLLALIGETSARIEGVLRASVREGRLYRLTFNVPAPWKLTLIEERPAEGAAPHEIAWTAGEGAESSRVEVLLGRAVGRGGAIDLQVRLEHAAFGESRAWERTELTLALPVCADAARNRCDLGIAIPASLDALMGALPEWRTMEAGDIDSRGLGATAEGQGLVLIAALTSRAREPALGFTLVRRAPRGEYQAVTHLLALERALRVRVDIQLTAVDRPIESIFVRLPAIAGPSTVILGDGIKEIEPDPEGRTVRFGTPWLGTRRFRVEFEAPRETDGEFPVPAVAVEAAKGEEVFGGERLLVLQSQGPVEIGAAALTGVTPADVDDVPEFAEPWRVGRVLSAYRFKARGEPGTLRCVVHGRAPVLKRLVRQMMLATTIGREGVTRTQAVLLLAYSRDQDFRVELPPDARVLGVTVNGEPIRTVITKPAAASAANTIAIPLPPQSYATVAVTYERIGGADAALGRSGTWREQAPRFPDMPVGETVWSVSYPPEYVFHLVRDGSFRANDARNEATMTAFAETFFGRILRGRWPVLTSFVAVRPQGDENAPAPLTVEERRGAHRAGAAAAQGRLVAREQRAAAWRSTMPLCNFPPEGRRVDAVKIGEGGTITFLYGERRWRHFAVRTMCIAGVLAGLLLFARCRFRRFVAAMLALLAAGTCVPFVLGIKSPLIAVPLCEGLVLALCAGAVLAALRGAFRLARGFERAAGKAEVRAGAAFLLAIALAGSGHAAEAAADLFGPAGGAIISYDTDMFPSVPSGYEKVFLPYARFRELWKLANPEKAAQEAPQPYDLVLGQAAYTLAIEGATARIKGTIAVNVLAAGWVAVPLPFDSAQLGSILVDGIPTGVGQAPLVAKGAMVPFVQIKGKGAHTIQVECTAAVRTEAGGNSVLAGLLAGAAASLRAELPPDAKVAARGIRPGAGDTPAALPVAVERSANSTAATVDLGGADRIELAWSFPKIEGQKGSQVESSAYASLAVVHGGFTIERRERVRVAGKPIDALSYTVEGAWRVTDVAGADVAEWSVLRDEGGAERLQIFFARPVGGAELLIRGRALLEGRAPLATLALKDAVAQETYVGLRHGRLARFAMDVLAGMQRATREDLSQRFGVAAEALPDRAYHAYGSGAGQTIAIEPVPVEVAVTTDAAMVVGLDRGSLSVRSRYEVSGPGPLRHEAAVPRGWSVRSVACGALRDWRTMTEGEDVRLVVTFAERAVTGTEITWSAERLWDAPPEIVELPEPVTIGVERESMHAAFAAADELELSVREAGRLIAAPLETGPGWAPLPALASFRFALRSPRSERVEDVRPIAVAVGRRESRLSALVVSFVRAVEDSIEVSARIVFRIRNAGRDRFRMDLPEGAALVSIATRNQRSREVRTGAGGAEIEIVLQSSIVGEHAVDIMYRMPRGGGAPRVTPITLFDGASRLDDVDQYVGVLQTGAAFVADAAVSGLVRVEAESVPYLPEGVSAGSLKPTYRATALAWSLSLAEEAIEVAEGAAAIVVLAELTTVVGEDGTARTRAVYSVQNRMLQFLMLELPEGVSLWGVTLNGKAVAVGEAAGPGAGKVLRVPVEHVGAGSLDLEVTVQYEERRFGLPALRGTASLRAPIVRDTTVLETIWNVQFPDGYRVSLSGGTMREVVGSMHYARKVQYLLEQHEKIARTATEADSRRVREQAQRDMARLEQVLGDNITELAASNRSSWEVGNASRLGQSDVQAQWDSNDDLILRSKEVQRSLKDVKEAQAKAQQAPTKREQAQLDAANFMQQGWSYNVVFQAGKKEPPKAAAGAEAVPSVRGLSLAPQKVEVEAAAPAAVDGSKGLAPVPEALLAATAPGLEVAPAAKGNLAYTFHTQGADAQLAMAFTRRDAVPRGLALLVLLAGLGAFVWWARREK